MAPELVEEQAEKIKTNFERFRRLCEKLGDNTEKVLKMIDTLGERLALCPASSKIHYHNAFPGGLVEHSLRVLAHTTKLVELYECEVKKEDLILSCLFHDIGKVGSMDHERYLPQTQNWLLEKGEIYEINKKCEQLPVPQMSMFLLQQFEIKLDYVPYTSILYNDGLYIDENKNALKSYRVPLFCTLLHQGDLVASIKEKNRTKLP